MCLNTIRKLTSKDLEIREGFKVFARYTGKYSIISEVKGHDFPNGLPKRRWLKSIEQEIHTEEQSYISGWHVFINKVAAFDWAFPVEHFYPPERTPVHRVLIKDISAIGTQYPIKTEILVCKQIFIMEEVRK